MLVACLSTLLLSCGEDKSLQPASGSTYGSAGNVLVADTDGHQLWVGFNSSGDWDYFLERNRDGAPTIMIGGKVVSDSTQTLGFYFNPDSTMARGASEALNGLWLQATLDEIKANPSGYTWAHGVLVPVSVQRYVSGKMW
jgi:hypothetical protein